MFLGCFLLGRLDHACICSQSKMAVEARKRQKAKVDTKRKTKKTSKTIKTENRRYAKYQAFAIVWKKKKTAKTKTPLKSDFLKQKNAKKGKGNKNE